jgi:hypothetical protein
MKYYFIKESALIFANNIFKDKNLLINYNGKVRDFSHFIISNAVLILIIKKL